MKTIGTVGGAVFSGGNPVAGAVAGQVFGDAVGIHWRHYEMVSTRRWKIILMRV